MITDLVDDRGRNFTDEQKIVRFICSDSFTRRGYMCLGSSGDDIELRNGQVKLSTSSVAEGFPVMSFGQSEREVRFSGQATFDVLQSGFSQKVFFTVYARGERVVLQTLADNFDEERDRLEGVDVWTD